MFAITDRFSRVATLDLPRAYGASDSQEIMDLLKGVTSGQFRVVDAPQLDRARASRLAEAVASLYCDAYPDTKMPNGHSPGRECVRFVLCIRSSIRAGTFQAVPAVRGSAGLPRMSD